MLLAVESRHVGPRCGEGYIEEQLHLLAGEWYKSTWHLTKFARKQGVFRTPDCTAVQRSSLTVVELAWKTMDSNPLWTQTSCGD